MPLRMSRRGDSWGLLPVATPQHRHEERAADDGCDLLVGVDDLAFGVDFVEAEVAALGDAADFDAELAFDGLADGGFVGARRLAERNGQQRGGGQRKEQFLHGMTPGTV